MSEQSARNSHLLRAEVKGSQQIEQDVVVVAGVEGDVLNAPGLRQGAHDVDGLIAIEGRHLDRDHVFDFEELPPELIRQETSSDRRLQVEAHDWNHGCDGASVFEEFGNACVAQIAKT